jgi:hypothetical protein
VNEINRSAPNDILRRLFTVKGDVPPSPVLGAELIPAIVLEMERPEWLFLANIRRAVFESSQISVSGQRCKCVLENPAGSGMLVIVERLNLYTGFPIPNTLSAFLRYAGPDLPVNGVGGFFGNGTGTLATTQLNTDFRWFKQDASGQGKFPAARCWNLTDGNGMGGGFIADICADTNILVHMIGPERAGGCRMSPLVLPPGTKLGVDNAVNSSLCALWEWIERPIEPNEQPIGMR